MPGLIQQKIQRIFPHAAEDWHGLKQVDFSFLCNALHRA
jgi:hypothetical protein